MFIFCFLSFSLSLSLSVLKQLVFQSFFSLCAPSSPRFLMWRVKTEALECHLISHEAHVWQAGRRTPPGESSGSCLPAAPRKVLSKRIWILSLSSAIPSSPPLFCLPSSAESTRNSMRRKTVCWHLDSGVNWGARWDSMETERDKWRCEMLNNPV